MKKDAEGKLHEVLLSDGQPYLYQTVTSDANGDVLFPYLPRLEEGERMSSLSNRMRARSATIPPSRT